VVVVVAETETEIVEEPGHKLCIPYANELKRLIQIQMEDSVS
jgi:hypothetical protein